LFLTIVLEDATRKASRLDRGASPETVPAGGAGSGSLRLWLVPSPAGVGPLPDPRQERVSNPLLHEEVRWGTEKCRGGAPRGERPDRKGRETPRKRLDVPRKHVTGASQAPRVSRRSAPPRSPASRKEEGKVTEQLRRGPAPQNRRPAELCGWEMMIRAGDER
jgi:hypothetical protein